MAIRWHEELRPCPICGADEYVILGQRGGDAHHSRLGVATTVVRCSSCHGVYPRPSLVPDGNPYAEHAASDYFALHVSSVKVDAGRLLADRASRLLGGAGRLLELGCGRGEHLLGAKQAGWDVQGVDMTDWPPVSSEIPIERAPVERALSLSRTYDAILLPAILEHLYDPTTVLARTRAALSAGGVVFLDVPNECSLWSRAGNAYMALRGRRWAVNLSPTFPPFHVVGFCPRSLRHILDRAGLDVVELRTHRWPNAFAPGRGLVSRLEHRAGGMVLSLGARLGMGAGITCWARKREEGGRTSQPGADSASADGSAREPAGGHGG